jgi:hypothetical protein
VLDDGRRITAGMVRAWIPEELARVKQVVGADRPNYDEAARLFADLTTAESFADVLTLPLYELLRERQPGQLREPAREQGSEPARALARGDGPLPSLADAA